MVFDFERNRLRQQEIEVQALVALMRYGRTYQRKVAAEGKLCEIAFPEDHIKQIEQETLVLSGNMKTISYDDDGDMFEEEVE